MRTLCDCDVKGCDSSVVVFRELLQETDNRVDSRALGSQCQCHRPVAECFLVGFSGRLVEDGAGQGDIDPEVARVKTLSSAQKATGLSTFARG